MLKQFRTATALAAALLLAGCAAVGGSMSDDGGSQTAAMSERNIVEVAAGDDRFDTLVTAVQEAGLADTLSGEGPFTVFAPTDAAFDKLPEGTVESLLKPENRRQLQAILTYHVVPGRVMAADIAGKRLDADTVNGQPLPIDATGSGVQAGNANVVVTDVPASNGVIHAVDSVIMPN
jgi:uncharacterized surface protein with fasciclin (FAS1) repeats